MSSADDVLRNALVDAYDAIVHALNYPQETHIWQHLRQAQRTVIDALHPENAGTQIDGVEVCRCGHLRHYHVPHCRACIQADKANFCEEYAGRADVR